MANRIKYKEWIANKMMGMKCRFECDCVFPIDVTGTIVGYSIKLGEILYKVETTDHKIVTIAENHPNLYITAL